MKHALFAVALATLFIASPAFAEGTYQLSSHILDINRGLPAPNVKITLKKLGADNKWEMVSEKFTDDNGRVKDFLPSDGSTDNRGIYKLRFHVLPYFTSLNQQTFYPFIDVVFMIKDNKHYHVPITLSPFGYSTYRGS